MSRTLYPNLKTVVLAGGVGGAKMVNGLAQILPPENLFIIANTGDDFEHLGLSISPDLDTIMYTLAGVNNRETGWGRAGETWRTTETLATLCGPTWFKLGDKDLATHLLRTEWRRSGFPLSWVTTQLCRRFGVQQTLIPMSDSSIQTIVHTERGELSFQDYFVRHRCEPRVLKLEYRGAEVAEPDRSLLSTIRMADVIIFAPSNPLLSIAPILSMPGMVRIIGAAVAPKIAVSPIIGGQAVKGPAAKIMTEFSMEVSPFGVANYLKDVLSGFVFDDVDAAMSPRIKDLGLRTYVTDTMMYNEADQARLAREVIEFALNR